MPRAVPTYDYRCQECGHTVEIIHSILDDGPDTCERCRGLVQRVLHPAGLIFRGRGFYTTDSRKEAPAASGTPATGGEGGGSTKESGGAPGGTTGAAEG